jgi:hypothetical protein
MHPQLRHIEEELVVARDGFRRLGPAVAGRLGTTRPGPDAWSASECVVHLLLTSRAVLPALRSGLDEARRRGGRTPARLHRGFVGWMIWRSLAPRGGMRSRTGAPFSPAAASPGDVHAALAEFEAVQDEQLALLRAADGLPLHRVRISSPFEPRIRYNLYAAFSIVSVHQLRHLRQAERAVEAAGRG